MKVEELLGLLEGVKQVGPGRWMALCPVHGDRNPSLSIRETEDGRVLLYCFAGCDTASVLQTLGLTWADLGKNQTSYPLKRAVKKAFQEVREETLDRAADLLREIDQLLLSKPVFEEPWVDRKDYLEFLWDEARKGDEDALRALYQGVQKWAPLKKKCSKGRKKSWPQGRRRKSNPNGLRSSSTTASSTNRF